MTVCFTAGAVLLAALGSFASGSVTAVIVLVTLSYGIVGSVNAVLYLYTPEIYPTRMRAIGTGSATCWLRLASAAGPLLVGYFVASQGTGAVFLMFAARRRDRRGRGQPGARDAQPSPRGHRACNHEATRRTRRTRKTLGFLASSSLFVTFVVSPRLG